MSDQPPRIRVTLPGGRDLPGRLAGWQQGPDGRWWAQVEVHVPAAAVEPVDGEDYTAVPRTPHTPAAPATDAGPRFVLVADTRTKPPTAEVHLADCWTIAKPAAWRRVTPIPTERDARDQMKIPGTTACTVCRPFPDLP